MGLHDVTRTHTFLCQQISCKKLQEGPKCRERAQAETHVHRARAKLRAPTTTLAGRWQQHAHHQELCCTFCVQKPLMGIYTSPQPFRRPKKSTWLRFLHKQNTRMSVFSEPCGRGRRTQHTLHVALAMPGAVRKSCNQNKYFCCPEMLLFWVWTRIPLWNE